MPIRKQEDGPEGDVPEPGAGGGTPPSGDPPAPPSNGHQPPSDGGDDWGEAHFQAILTEFFQGQVLPNLTRHFDEVIEARIADLGARVDPRLAAKEAAEILGPQVSREVQAVVNELTARIVQVERVAEHAAQQAGGIPAARSEPVTMGQQPSATGRELATDKVSGWVALAQSLVDYGTEKIWPLIQQNQMMKLMGMRDMVWAQQLRETNPFMAQALANTLAPDQLTNMMAMTIPSIAAQAMAQGMRARNLAQALARDPAAGGLPWPGTPSPGSPGSSLMPGGTPSGSTPGQPGPNAGASMAQKPRPKPKPRLSGGLKQPAPEASAPVSEPPASQVPPVVRRLADLA